MAPRPDAEPRRLPASLYSAAISDFADLAASGFTMVGPYYGSPPGRELLDEAAAAGLGVVFPVGYPNAAYRSDHTIAWTPEQSRIELGTQVDAVVGHPAVAAWYLMPEELRPSSARDLEYIEVVTRTVREHDPRKRPLLAYQPNLRPAKDLAPIVAYLDVSTAGAYTDYTRHHEQRAWVRWAVEQMLAARPEGRDVPVWAALEMFEDPSDAAAPIERWVRHDAYLALVTGARGILVYSGWRERPGFSTFERYLEAYRDVVAGLNVEPGLADVFLRGEPAPALGQPTVVSGPTTVQVDVRRQPLVYPSVASASFDLEGTLWSFLVNSATTRVVVALPGGPWVRVDGRDGEPSEVGPQLALPPLEVAVLRESGEAPQTARHGRAGR